jgi:hypothetical protein
MSLRCIATSRWRKMRIHAEIRKRLSRKDIEELSTTKGKAGRPVGSQKFAEIDHQLIALADQYLREHPDISVKAGIFAVVTEMWNRTPVESKHDFYEREQIGASLDGACQRVFARLRDDMSLNDEVYSIARHIKKRVRKTAQLK